MTRGAFSNDLTQQEQIMLYFIDSQLPSLRESQKEEDHAYYLNLMFCKISILRLERCYPLWELVIDLGQKGKIIDLDYALSDYRKDPNIIKNVGEFVTKYKKFLQMTGSKVTYLAHQALLKSQRQEQGRKSESA